MTEDKYSTGRILLIVAFAIAVSIDAFGVFAAMQQRPASRPAAAKPAEPAKVKAIWEPVNVPEDVELFSIHFVNAETGWVAGGKTSHAGGVIYRTTDGGNKWELQVGDPESSDRGFTDLRFVDATHGFAVQGSAGSFHKLYSTSDGQAWAPTGSVPEHRYDYIFTSTTTGFIADWGRNILRTTDGGKTWKSAYACKIKTQIEGLTRDAECYMNQIHFPTPMIGYAIGGPLPNNGGNVLAKTEDGGATWNAWVVLPGESSKEGSLWFLDPNNGLLRVSYSKLFRTADGGKTWNGVSGEAEMKSIFSFADSDAGWAILHRKMAYTSNGGKSWVSREINFPEMVNDSSFPVRDRGYVVGAHGMVYRYRVVPGDYTSKGMLAAPLFAAK